MTAISLSMKRAFFDTAAIARAVDQATRRNLSKFAAHVRQNARQNQLRRRKRPSLPGQPPSVHSTQAMATLKNILFAYDRTTKSAIVGPVKLNMRTQDWITLGAITVPQLMEHGGVAQIKETSYDGLNWRRQDLRRRIRPDKRYRKRRAVYRPRPFMAPALAAEGPKFADLWKNSIAA